MIAAIGCFIPFARMDVIDITPHYRHILYD